LSRLLKIACAIAIIIFIPKIVMKVAFGGDKKAQTLSAVKTIAEEVSRTLPKKVDNTTTLTKVEVEGTTYRIHYTVDPSVRIDPANRPVYEKAARQQICGTDMRKLIDGGVTIEYFYTFTSDNGTGHMPVAVAPGDCV